MKHILLCLLFLFIASKSFSQNKIAIVEISTSLYGKPLSGFRFLLPLPREAIRRVIHHHFDSLPLLDLEEVVALDQVRYAPVSEEHPVSLYFLLHPLADNATQVTVCGQYSSTRSITLADAPDLALRLLMEVSQMTEAAGQGILDLEPLLANQLPQQIRQRYQERHESLEQQLYMTTGPLLQSGEVPQTLLHHSPFGDQPPALEAPDARIADLLSERFSRYVAGESPTVIVRERENLRLRDSLLRQLQAGRELAARQQTQIAELEQRLAAFDPESQQAKQQLQAYKQRLADLEQREAALGKTAAETELQYKLVEQRLKYLAEYEREHDAAVLLTRIRELEEALQRLEFAQIGGRAN